jgi:hypothetical protein
VRPEAPLAEAEELAQATSDATYGTSRYLGEALLPTDSGQPSADDPLVASAIARTRAVGGSPVLILAGASDDIRFAIHPIDPYPS